MNIDAEEFRIQYAHSKEFMCVLYPEIDDAARA